MYRTYSNPQTGNGTSSNPYNMEDSRVDQYEANGITIFSTDMCVQSGGSYLRVYRLFNPETNVTRWTWTVAYASGFLPRGTTIYDPFPYEYVNCGGSDSRFTMMDDPFQPESSITTGVDTGATGGYTEAQYQAVVDDLRNCEDGRRALENQLATTQQEAAKCDNSLSDCVTDRQRCEDNVNNLNRQMDDLQGQIADKDQQIQNLQDTISDLQSGAAGGEEIVQQLQQELQDCRDKLAATEQDLSDLQNAPADTTADCREQEAVIVELQNKIDELEQTLADKENLLLGEGTCETLLAECERIRNELEQRLLDTEAALEAEKAKHACDCEDIAAIQNERDTIQAAFDTTELNLDACKNELADWKQRYGALEKRYQLLDYHRYGLQNALNELLIGLENCQEEVARLKAGGGRGDWTVPILVGTAAMAGVFWATRTMVGKKR